MKISSGRINLPKYTAGQRAIPWMASNDAPGFAKANVILQIANALPSLSAKLKKLIELIDSG